MLNWLFQEKYEIVHFLFAILIYSFFSSKLGLNNTAIVIALSFFLPNFIMKKIIAKKHDCYFHYKISSKKFIISLLINLISLGNFFIPIGESKIIEKEIREIKYKYKLTRKEEAIIFAIPIIVNILLALLFSFASNELAKEIAKYNILYVILKLLPIPKFDGSFIISYSILLFSFLFILSVFLSISIFFSVPITISIAIAIIFLIAIFVILNK